MTVFETAGRDNTDETLRLSFARGRELGLSEVVVASSKGDTAIKALEIFEGFRVVAVTYHAGFTKPFQAVMPVEVRRELTERGATVVGGSHALSGIERSVAGKFGGIYPALIVAEALRLFGQGVKVAVEVAVMAADAGALSGADVVAIGGTGRGADGALIVAPAHQNNFFDLKVREVVCKPRDF